MADASGSPLPTTTEPGRELDELIRYRFFGGWNQMRCRVCGWLLGDNPNLGCVVGNCAQRPSPTTHADTPAPYSTDIAAAFLVVEKLRADGWDLTFGDNSLGWWIVGGRDEPSLAVESEELPDNSSFPFVVCCFALAALAALENAHVGAPPSTGGGR